MTGQPSVVMRISSAVTTVLLLLALPREARAQTQASAELLRRWVTAAREHVPGQADASAGVVAEWSYGDRARLHPSMELFLAMVRGEGVPDKTDPQRQIIDLFRSVRVDTGVVTFLKRAAVLHTDAAIFRDRFPAPVDDAPAQPLSRITTDARGNLTPLEGRGPAAAAHERSVRPAHRRPRRRRERGGMELAVRAQPAGPGVAARGASAAERPVPGRPMPGHARDRGRRHRRRSSVHRGVVSRG